MLIVQTDQSAKLKKKREVLPGGYNMTQYYKVALIQVLSFSEITQWVMMKEGQMILLGIDSTFPLSDDTCFTYINTTLHVLLVMNTCIRWSLGKDIFASICYHSFQVIVHKA